jgi:ADP-heptose:LPS heptosyltransferase
MEEEQSEHILILRFSALGDIAIAAPLVRAYAQANPGIRFTMVSQPIMEPLFKGVENLSFFAVDLKGRHKGLRGLCRLSRELRTLHPSKVVDIHAGTRTMVLKLFMRLRAIPFHSLDKGRRERSELTRKKDRTLRQLPSMMSRYEQVFNETGLVALKFAEREVDFQNRRRTNAKRGENETRKSETFSIGIAPFAKHKGREWPLDHMEAVVATLSEESRFAIYLFGGGGKEATILQGWEQRYSGIVSVAGKHSFAKEFEMISDLDLMVCMDSANMHFASYAGVPVLSIWGATHPYMGFYGWGQKPEMALQDNNLDCRPCSEYGNKECYKGNWICLHTITPQYVLDKIFEIESDIS